MAAETSTIDRKELFELFRKYPVAYKMYTDLIARLMELFFGVKATPPTPLTQHYLTTGRDIKLRNT